MMPLETEEFETVGVQITSNFKYQTDSMKVYIDIEYKHKTHYLTIDNFQ